MARKRYIQAINEALFEEMERDPKVILFGEDVALAGGVFAVLLMIEAHTVDAWTRLSPAVRGRATSAPRSRDHDRATPRASPPRAPSMRASRDALLSRAP